MNFNFYSIFYVIIIQIIIFVNSENFNECRRNCEEISSPKKCIYEFNVSRLNHINNDCGDSEVNNCNKKWFGINGKSPGPSIEICLGDSLEIIVHNKLKTEEVTFHWHGINQRNSAHMDGVSMITQCPILPFTSYRYHIVPEYTGTFYYHTHSVLQEGDGLYGSLIVRGPQELLALEKIIMISSRSSSPLSSLAQSQPPTPTALTINGENKNVEFQVNKENKLRLINANVFNCPVAFSIAKHSMSIVGADGRTIEPVKSASKIIIFPGERMDVKIITKTPAGKYKIYIQGIYECKNLIYEGTLSYHNDESVETVIQEDENYYLEIPNDSFKGHDCNRLGNGVVCSMDLTSSSNEIDEKSEEIFATYYIPFDVNSYNHIDDKMTDYSFNIYEFSYYPSYLTTNNGDVKIPQINHVTFKYPPSPILSQYHSIPDDIFCSLTEKSKSCDYNRDFCECLQIFEVPPNKIIDIILINEGFGSNTSHVFHLHGYTAKILGVKSFNNPITKDEIINLDNAGKLEKNNNNNPLLKDTFVVPNKGYTIIRLSTNNLGYWLWESRVTGTSPDTTGPTMEILMRVGTLENLPTVPIDFPTCGNHRGPDSIFEED